MLSVAFRPPATRRPAAARRGDDCADRHLQRLLIPASDAGRRAGTIASIRSCDLRHLGSRAQSVLFEPG